MVNWDNQELGFVTAAGTRGSAVARFRAAGPAGDHIVKLYTGWQGLGYLNYEQSPVAALPRPQFTFRTTAGAIGDAAYAEPYQPQPIPTSDSLKSGARLSLSPTQGPVGTRAVLKGEGFAAGASMRLVWETYVGSRVTAKRASRTEEQEIGEINADANGRIERTLDHPRRSRRPARPRRSPRRRRRRARALRRRNQHRRACRRDPGQRARRSPFT